MNMHETLRQSLRRISPCLGLLILSLALAGCTAKAPPLSPKAAAFKKDVRGILARLAPALAGPLSQNDAKAAEQAILSLFPTAGQDKDDFPFRVGVLTKDGIMLTSLPPVQVIGGDFIHYQQVKETLDKQRLSKERLYAPKGASLYFFMAPVMAQNNCVGLVLLRLTADQALRKWGITEPEFEQMDLN
jgi:hypothetical protein